MSKCIAATVLLRRPDGRILMQLRDDGRGVPIPFPNMWNFPGGAVEPHETPLARSLFHTDVQILWRAIGLKGADRAVSRSGGAQCGQLQFRQNPNIASPFGMMMGVVSNLE